MLGVYLRRSCSGFCFVNRGQAVSTSPQVPGYNRNWKKLKREWQKGHIILGHSNKDPCTLQSLHFLVPKPYPSSWVDAASREGSGNRLWAPLLLFAPWFSLRIWISIDTSFPFTREGWFQADTLERIKSLHPYLQSSAHPYCSPASICNHLVQG